MTFYARVEYPANNLGETAFAVPFQYLQKAHVHIYTKDEAETTYITELEQGTDFDWTSSSVITLNTPRLNDVDLLIVRATPASELLVEVQPGGISSQAINLENLHLLYIEQEALDAFSLAGNIASEDVDPTLRADLLSPTGATRVKLAAGDTVEARLAGIPTLLKYRNPHLYDYTASDPETVTDWATALTAAGADTGRAITLPGRTLPFASGVTILGNNISWIAEPGCTLAPSFATGDIITVGDNVSECYGIELNGFTVMPSVVRSSGFAVKGYLLTRSKFVELYFDTLQAYTARGSLLHYGGYAFDGFDNISVEAGQLVGAGTGLQLNGRFNPGFPAQQSYGAEFDLGGRTRFLKFAKGIHLGGAAGGVHLGSCDLSLCDTGVRVDTALKEAYNRELWLDPGFQVDVSKNFGLDVGADAIGLLAARGAWINSTSMAAGQAVAGSCNVHFDASTGLAYGLPVVADFVGCDIGNAYGSGMELNQGQVLVNDCRIRGNGAGAPGGHGVHISNANVNATLRDNVFINNGNVTKGYDVSRDPAATGSSRGNRHAGSGQGGYDSAQTSTFAIAENEGYNTAVTDKPSPDVEWGHSYTQGDAKKTLAASGTFDLATGSGRVILHDDTTGDMAEFLCYGGTVVKVAGAASMVVGAPGASQIGVFYNGGTVKYRVQNGYAVAHNIYICTEQTRPTS